MIVWEYAKRIAEVISTRYRDKLPYSTVRGIELAVETMNESQFIEELYFAVRALWREYSIADRELLDLIEKAIKL
jgi:hypothetical protein